MVFCDGMVAMASLNDCGTPRGSLAVSIPHHMRTKAIQFGIIYRAGPSTASLHYHLSLGVKEGLADGRELTTDY